MGVEIKILRDRDVGLLSNVAAGVFDHAINPALASEFLADDRHHLAVAIDCGQVVASASAVHYVHPDKPPELWVNEVCVAPSYRGHGIGKQLLLSLFDVATEIGCKEAWVLTEEENHPAIRLYKSLAGRATKQVMFNFSLSRSAQ